MRDEGRKSLYEVNPVAMRFYPSVLDAFAEEWREACDIPPDLRGDPQP